MKNAKKIFSLILVAVLLTLVLGACGGQSNTVNDTGTKSSDSTTTAAKSSTTEAPAAKNWITATDISDMPETTIRYWFYETPERVELGKKQVEEFQKKFPNIKVKGSTAPDYTDNEMLMTYVTSRTNSNIHQSVNNEDTWYIDHNVLYPLNNFPDFKEFYDRFNPDLNYTWKDGNTYSISWYNDPMLMYYNKKMLEKAGWDVNKLPETYSEFYDLAKKVTNPANKNWVMAPSMGEEWWQWEFLVQPFYIAATGSSQVINTDGKTVMFNNPNGVKALEFFQTLFKNGWAYKEKADVDPFTSGQVAATIQGSWEVKTLQDNAPKDFEYLIGKIPVPDGVTRGAKDSFAFVRNFCIMDELGVAEGEERDRVRRASWEFMKFLLSDEQSAADFAVSGDFPCFKDLENNSAVKPVLEQYGEKMKQIMALSKSGVIGDMNSSYECQVMDPLQKAYLKVAYDGMSAADAMAWAETEANKVIAAGGK